MSSPPAIASERHTGVGHAIRQRVFIIDEHPVCRHGMAQLINSEPDLIVCGEAENAQQALAALRTTRAELILLDVSPQNPAALDLIRQIRVAHSHTALLAISSSDESLFALRTLRSGAKGYLMKREGLHQFVAAIRKVLSGQIYVNPTFGEQLIAQIAQGETPTPAAPVERLTERELEVLRLLGSGQGTKQIAETLRVSHKTVESHRLHIKEKLGIGSAPELVRFAASWLAQQGGM